MPPGPKTVPTKTPAARRPLLGEAYGVCEGLTMRRSKGIAAAIRLMPRELRPHAFAIHAFAQMGDPPAGGRAAARPPDVDDLRTRLRACAEHPGDHPVFMALGHTIRARRLPLEPFEDLLTGFRMQAEGPSLSTFDDLLRLCAHTANPLGHLTLLLLGHPEPRLSPLSDAVSTALRLTSHWQDLGADLARGRCFLPAADIDYFGLEPADLGARKITPPLRALLTFEINRTRALFARGAPLCDLVGGRLGFQIRVVSAAGLRLLDKIEQAGCDVFRGRIELTATDWGRLLLKVTSERRAPSL